MIRHAQSEGNVASIAESIGDSPLTDVGRSQAARIAQWVVSNAPGAAALYASPQGRAWRTAEVVGRRLTLDVRSVPDFRECEIGEWEGLKINEINFALLRNDPDYTLHGGESPREFSRRTASAIRRIVTGHAGRTVVAVSHAGVIAGGLAMLLGTRPLFGNRFNLGNAGVAEVFFDPVARVGRVLRTIDPQESSR